MRNFYIRLAVSNIKKNKPVYYPFFLTNILSVMIFYVMASIQNQTIIATLPGSYIFVQFLKVGVVMTGMFAGVFLLYTNGLLIRQRKKELNKYIASGKCSNDCLVLDGSHTKENHYGQDICQKERVIYGLILFNIR